MIDEIDPEDAQRDALDNACERAYFFKGKRLHPFSFARQAAAQRLNIASDSMLESWTLLVYLCTLGPELIEGTSETGIDRIDKARGEDGLRQFRRHMEKWADDNGIGFGSPVAMEVRDIATAIWNDVFHSEVTPDVRGGSGSKKSSP